MLYYVYNLILNETLQLKLSIFTYIKLYLKYAENSLQTLLTSSSLPPTKYRGWRGGFKCVFVILNENVSHQRLESSSQQQKLSSITEPNERINHEMDSKKYSTKNSISRGIYSISLYFKLKDYIVYDRFINIEWLNQFPFPATN